MSNYYEIVDYLNRRSTSRLMTVFADLASRRRGLLGSLDGHEMAVCPRVTEDGMVKWGASMAARMRHLAAALLGTRNLRRGEFAPTCRLYPLQPGQTRLGLPRRRLALSHISPLCATGPVAPGLGKRTAIG
jgi:hypothetical protein